MVVIQNIRLLQKHKKEPLPIPKLGIDRGFWFVFRAFKQVPKSTLILALLLELDVDYRKQLLNELAHN